MDFLQDLRFDDPLLNMATVLVAGIIGGELFAAIRLPKVTGWIATGIVLRQLKLPGMASDFYTTQVARHLHIGLRAMESLREMPLERLHSRKLRSFDETAFL